MSARRTIFALVFTVAATTSPGALADDAGVSDAGTIGDAGAQGDAGASIHGCVESIPKGAQRPDVTDAFPPRGVSGWAATLSIVVRHGRGERVLPSGLDLSSGLEAKKLLAQAGFVVPEQDGGAAAQLSTEKAEGEEKATTRLDLSLVLLPKSPGRQTLELPPLPIAIARANGEIATVCTAAHTILVEDPTANDPEAKPKDNPPPRPQREEWTSLKRAVIWGSLGLVAGAIVAYVAYLWLTRPKPPPPPPPPRPPWEVALEKLDEVRHAGLLDANRHAEYFDRVSDAVRSYLGARFGFDGLESTTDEILAALRLQAGGFVRFDGPISTFESSGPAPGIALAAIARFLSECDLVKFANLTPTPDQCTDALSTGEQIVRSTTPQVAPGPAASAPKLDAEPPEAS